MGYKVAGTANSNGSIIGGHAGRFRTYTHIDGDFSWAKIAQGIRVGACVASSGPMVLFEVDGQRPGAEFPAERPVASSPAHCLVQSIARRDAGLGAGASQR